MTAPFRRLIPVATLLVGVLLGLALGTSWGRAEASNFLAACKVATHATATPKKPAIVVKTLVDLSGTTNKQSATFTAPGSFTVGWKTSYLDASVGIGLFSVDLYGADGTLLDELVSATTTSTDTTVVHDDCTKGCYLKISADNIRYRFVVVS